MAPDLSVPSVLAWIQIPVAKAPASKLRARTLSNNEPAFSLIMMKCWSPMPQWCVPLKVRSSRCTTGTDEDRT